MSSAYLPNQVFIEKGVTRSIITERVLERLSGVPVYIIDSVEQLREKARTQTPTISVGKRTLVLTRHQGSFFKSCPASRTRGEAANVCCNYFVINFASNCHMECSYCYLQAYLNFPYIVVHANIEDLTGELESALAASPGSFFRIGTGELADSLALDPLTGYAQRLVEFFAAQRNAVLELKTKTDCVEGLLGLEHRGRTVVAWSMNTRYVQKQEEHKTDSIEDRLRAARKCADSGYRLGFHFDPLVHYPDWESDYRRLVGEIFDTVPAAAIAWFSIGSLRMTSGLRDTMRSRFPRSFLPLGELVPCPDGKLRYAKSIRTRMYVKVLEWIRARASASTGVYACMERPEVWSRVFETSPPADSEIGELVTAGVQSDSFRSQS